MNFWKWNPKLAVEASKQVQRFFKAAGFPFVSYWAAPAQQLGVGVENSWLTK